MTRALALLAAVGLALLGQWLFDAGAAATGVTLAAAAVLLFARASRGVALPGAAIVPHAPAPGAPRRRWLLGGAGAALAVAGCAQLAPNAFTAGATAAWIGGIALVLIAVWDAAVPQSRAAPPWWVAAGVVAALGIAAVLRFHLLDDLPAEAGPDIPLKLQIVRGMVAGERPIFSTVYPGREVGFFYIVALYAAAFGADQHALKLVSATLSLATLPLLYALGARWFGRGVGLWAAAWLALSPWHVSISRIGYRGVLTPLMTVLAMLALDRAVRRGARRDWALLGLVAGACAYTYTAALAVPLALGCVWAAGFAGRRWRRPPAVPAGWALALLLMVLALLPLARFAAGDPATLGSRAASRLTERPGYAVGERLLGNAARSLAMFNWRGDMIATQNAPFQRQLGGVSGALFLCGIGAALARWREPRGALPLLFLLVMQVPSALALAFPGEVPGAVRASGALIPACLLSALPLPLVWRALPRVRRGGAALAGAALLAAALLLREARETWQRYFVVYAAAQPFGNYPMTRTIAATIDAQAGRRRAVLPAYAHWIDGNAVRMQLRRMPAADYREPSSNDAAALLAAVEEPALVILRPGASEHRAALRGAFPRGRFESFRDAAGQVMFEAFYTPPDP